MELEQLANKEGFNQRSEQERAEVVKVVNLGKERRGRVTKGRILEHSRAQEQTGGGGGKTLYTLGTGPRCNWKRWVGWGGGGEIWKLRDTRATRLTDNYSYVLKRVIY